jgi:hypothetical protein
MSALVFCIMFLRSRRKGFWGAGLLWVAALMLFAVVPQPVTAAKGSGVRIIASDAQHVVLEVNAPAPEFETRVADGVTYQTVAVQGWDNWNEPGKPRLPLTAIMVAVPQRAQVRLKTLSDETTTVSMDAPPLPAPTMRVDYTTDSTQPQPTAFDYVQDAAVYQGAAPFPETVAHMSTPAKWRSQRYVTVRVAPYQYDAAHARLVIHSRLQIEIDFGVPPGAAAVELGSRVEEGPFEALLRKSFVNYRQAREWRAAETPDAAELVAPEAVNAVSTVRIAVDTDGIYKVTCDQLTAAGMALTNVALNTFHLRNNGVEVAIDVRDANNNNRCNAGEFFMFWGQRANSEYSNVNMYWLTYGGAAGKRAAVRPGTGTGVNAAAFPDSMRQEQNNSFIGYMPWNESADHWWWYPVPNSFDPDKNGDASSMDFTFALNTPVTTGTAMVHVLLGAVSNTAHRTQIMVNGTVVYDQTWSGVTTRQADVSFNANLLKNGSNVVRVKELVAAPNFVWINTVDLDYNSPYNARSSTLLFKQPTNGTWTYTLKGFTGNNVDAYDVSDPNNIARVKTTTTQSGATYNAKFTDAASSPRTYFALTNAQRKAPLSVVGDAGSNLKSTANGADYIIITPAAFKSAVQPLATYRATQMRVHVVDVQDIYDEFNDGEMHAQAIRDFLAYAYKNWKAPAPSFVLLVGNGNLNLKNYSAYPIETNYIPPYLKLVDPWIGMTASDHRFVTLDAGSPLPSMAIGRLPALSATAVTGMVNKILNYEKTPPTGAWRSTVSFVADDAFAANGTADPAGNFWALSDLIAGKAAYMPAPMQTNRIYFNPCTNVAAYPWCMLPYASHSTSSATRTALLSAVNAGRLIVNYVGHSAISAWSQNALKAGDAAALTNGAKLFMLLPMTCYDGYFHLPGSASVSEAMVTRAGGGAIASWAPTGLGVATHHDVIDRAFFEAVMTKGIKRIGPAIQYSKAALYASGSGLDLLDTFNLLGDPATKLALPAELKTKAARRAAKAAEPTAAPTDAPPVSATPEPTVEPQVESPVTAITVESKRAQALVKWETASEENIVGFNVWRAPKSDKWVKLNDAPLPAQSGKTEQGGKYKYADATARAGKLYRYRIEILYADGSSGWTRIRKLTMAE